MAGPEDDKTKIGGVLPGASDSSGSGSPFDAPLRQPPGGARTPADSDRTIIGGALPPVQPRPPAQSGASGGDSTWLGGPLGQPPRPRSDIGSAPGSQNPSFFPEIPRNAPAPQQPIAARIPLEQALQGAGLGKGGSSNPLIAAAANLLILFGRLRTGLVEMQAAPLMDHVIREIDQFEQNAIAGGVDPHEAQVAKYALCGTADDIVQNLPGADRGQWLQYSMVARFFNKRDSGVGFFQEAEKAMQAPGQRYPLLELMLTCLSLGFEGQYRTMPNGSVELARIRNAIYETLRRVTPRPDDDISVKWMPVLPGGRRRFGVVPLWAVGAIALAIVVALYATLSTLINRDGAQVATYLETLHPTQFNVALERGPGPVFVAQNTQLERVQQSLSEQIAQGLVEVGTKGDFIFVRVGNLLLFESGQASVKEDFGPLAQEVASTLNAEGGPIKIMGYTDSVQPSGRGRFKTNLDLSVARATGVRDILAGLLSDADRLSVEGRGPADPIADNATREGRALNRRVEIMIAREGTFQEGEL